MSNHKRNTSISQRIHDAVVGAINPQQPNMSDSLIEEMDSIPDLSLDAEDYEIGKCIGYGSSATVYAAQYKPNGMQVAIKSIDLDMFERSQIDELRKELSIMTLNRHKNLLPVYGSFVHGHFLQIVTPYVAAGSILDVLRNGNQDGLDETVIATILKQVLQGLNYLHKSNHIHRDIKAGNILLATDGHVFLADFGVSASLGDHGDRKLRRTFVGSVCWLSPEVVESQQGQGYDAKADMWSFGIAALEMANGRAPYSQHPPLKVLMMILSNEPPRLNRESCKYRYSRLFQHMIEVCLVKDSVKRPPAEKLLEHAFFKQAKRKDYLVKAVIEHLPPMQSRMTKKPQSKEKNMERVQSWTFDSVSKDDLSQMLTNAQLESAAVLNKNYELENQNKTGHRRKPSRFQIVQDTKPTKGVKFAMSDSSASEVSLSDLRLVHFQDQLLEIEDLINADDNVPSYLKQEVRTAFDKLQNSMDGLLAESAALKQQVQILKRDM